MSKWFALVLIGIGLWHTSVSAAQPFTLTVPAPLNGGKGQNPYIEELLHLIFASQGYRLDLRYASRPGNKARNAKMVSRGDEIDLLWANASVERARSLHEVRHPIYKGYIGWRVLIIHKDKSEQFSNVKSRQELASLVGAQRYDWADYRVLKSSRLKITSDLSFSAMFKAVESGVVDYFPRSVLEAQREVERHSSGHLKIADGILLRYPSASFFYVSKQNTELAQMLSEGFERIKQNGQFDRHFDSYFAEDLARLALNKRHVIELRNPFFKASH